ncbi:Exodeoxyribonuclease I [Buchnera aphidicola (Protaphis terricola)]
MIFKKKIYQENISTFLFYDYETFGVHTALDKPAQFASIRTDENLNIIEESKCFYCFPPDDYLPDPYSILITKITPQYTFIHGMNEYNFSKKIYDIFKKPNTCIIGYNNISFDDEITRNLFYRNFLDPYEWSWKNNNSRWDLLNIMRICYLLRPLGIKWPKNNLGFPIFKLSHLTQENNIFHNNVHDAISDVYATISLAKLVQKHQPKLFNFFFKYRKKNELYKLINLKNFQPLLYISSCFGSIRNNMSFVLPLSWDENNRNILITIDLFKNIENLFDFFNKYNYNEINIKDLFDLGIILIHFNRCPVFIPIQLIREEDIKKLKLKEFYIQKKINLIKKNYFIINYIKKIFKKTNIFQKSLNVDLQIYNNFFNFHDKKLIKKISSSNPSNLINIQLNFQDSRLNELFFRYKARNFFYLLNTNEKKIWLNYCLKVLNKDFLEEYIKKIENLIKNFSNDIDKINLLNELLKYTFKKYKGLFYQRFNLS